MDRATVIATLKSLEHKLRAVGVKALYLYGSYSRDEARPDSDLDVLAEFEPGRDQDFMQFMEPYQELEAAFPGIDIGFSTPDRLHPLYRPHIESSAVRVF